MELPSEIFLEILFFDLKLFLSMISVDKKIRKYILDFVEKTNMKLDFLKIIVFQYHPKINEIIMKRIKDDQICTIKLDSLKNTENNIIDIPFISAANIIYKSYAEIEYVSPRYFFPITLPMKRNVSNCNYIHLNCSVDTMKKFSDAKKIVTNVQCGIIDLVYYKKLEFICVDNSRCSHSYVDNTIYVKNSGDVSNLKVLIVNGIIEVNFDNFDNLEEIIDLSHVICALDYRKLKKLKKVTVDDSCGYFPGEWLNYITPNIESVEVFNVSHNTFKNLNLLKKLKSLTISCINFKFLDIDKSKNTIILPLLSVKKLRIIASVNLLIPDIIGSIFPNVEEFTVNSHDILNDSTISRFKNLKILNIDRNYKPEYIGIIY
jgi:hypothetical protein